MNQADWIKRMRQREQQRRRDDDSDRTFTSRTPEARERVRAIYEDFCAQYEQAKSRRRLPDWANSKSREGSAS